MIKRILTIIAATAAAISSVSCSEDAKPTVEFGKSLYTIYSHGEADVKIYLSEPAPATLSVPLILAGNAEEGTDYTISSKTVSIAAGETEGTVTVSDISLSEEKQISLSFTAPSGYIAGVRNVAVVAPDAQEALVYSFQYQKADVLEGYVARINITGAVSGRDVVTSEDIAIPISVSGEGSGDIVFMPESKTQPLVSPCAILPAGETSATIRFKAADGFSGSSAVLLSVDTDQAPRFIPGDNEGMILNIKGLQTPDKLIGTWAFKEIYDLE